MENNRKSLICIWLGIYLIALVFLFTPWGTPSVDGYIRGLAIGIIMGILYWKK